MPIDDDDDDDPFFNGSEPPGTEEIPFDSAVVVNLKRALADAKTMGNASLAAQLQKSIEDLSKEPTTNTSRNDSNSIHTRKALAEVVNGGLWLERIVPKELKNIQDQPDAIPKQIDIRRAHKVDVISVLYDNYQAQLKTEETPFDEFLKEMDRSVAALEAEQKQQWTKDTSAKWPSTNQHNAIYPPN